MDAPSASGGIVTSLWVEGAPLFAVQVTVPEWFGSSRWCFWDGETQKFYCDPDTVTTFPSEAEAQAFMEQHRTCCLKKLYPPSAVFTIRRLHVEATHG